jgi:hypothetical protein
MTTSDVATLAGQAQPDPAWEAEVRALLGIAGLSPSEEEVAVLVAQYPMQRAGVQLLRTMAGVRYASPALVFSATPVFAEWAEGPAA